MHTESALVLACCSSEHSDCFNVQVTVQGPVPELLRACPAVLFRTLAGTFVNG